MCVARLKLTREQSVRFEDTVGVHGEQFEALWEDQLSGWRLAGAVLAITRQNDGTLVSEVLTDALVGHG